MDKSGNETDAPLTDADLRRMKKTPQREIIRRVLKLNEGEFVTRFHNTMHRALH